MNMNRRDFVLATLGLSALITLGAVSIAAADPGGWAAWRVALGVWPISIVSAFVLLGISTA